MPDFTPIKRYRFRIAEAVDLLLGDDMTDAMAFEIRVEGGIVIVDAIGTGEEAGAPPPASGEREEDRPQEQARSEGERDGKAAPGRDRRTDPEPEPEEEREDLPDNGGDRGVHDEEAETRKGGPLAQQAGIMCTERAFWRYMDVDNLDDAVAALRKECKVGSRADLDHVPEAAQRFKSLRIDYQNWLKE